MPTRVRGVRQGHAGPHSMCSTLHCACGAPAPTGVPARSHCPHREALVGAIPLPARQARHRVVLQCSRTARASRLSPTSGPWPLLAGSDVRHKSLVGWDWSGRSCHGKQDFANPKSLDWGDRPFRVCMDPAVTPLLRPRNIYLSHRGGLTRGGGSRLRHQCPRRLHRPQAWRLSIQWVAGPCRRLPSSTVPTSLSLLAGVSGIQR